MNAIDILSVSNCTAAEQQQVPRNKRMSRNSSPVSDLIADEARWENFAAAL